MRRQNMAAGLAAGFFVAAGVTHAAGDSDMGLRTRESFNRGWLFARFGPQPDASVRLEPGESAPIVRASSEESDKGHAAALAVDGDADTRWCAVNSLAGHWLLLDLGRRVELGAMAVQWEREGAYRFTLEGSDDGSRGSWRKLLDGTGDRPARQSEEFALTDAAARYLRLTVTGMTAGQWASICEWRVFDRAKAPVAPQAPAGAATQPPQAVAFDDTAWRRLDVPHDWGVEGPFRADLPGNTGKLPWQGIGWYRKHFTVPASDAGRRCFIDFDGAMANAQVWLNGERVGGWPYGYTSFRLELTPFLKVGEENVLAVRLDTVHWGSRWYPGAGLYRNVWLVKTAPVHVGHWGVQLTTPAITAARGDVKLVVTVDNQNQEAVQAEVRTAIHPLAADGAPGKAVAEAAVAPVTLGAAASGRVTLSAAVPSPAWWSIEQPRLYVARTTVTVGGRVVDGEETVFGFRTLEFTPRDGFKLNGKRVEIRGTCNHHDLGPLGAAVNRRALERQVEILKEMGCNAWRTSHNPPAPELLELADRLGLLVQVEAFDCWRSGKCANDYARIFDTWHERDLQAMVRHYRNHPSVFMWSIGNEIHEQNGPALAKPLADIVRAEDPTRPVTAGCNNANAGVNGFQQAVDVFGLNYHTGSYAKLLGHAGNENKPFHSSESSSCISSRGEYFFPPARGEASRVNFQISSYDVDAPGWACPPDEEFAALDRFPAFMGEFVWTGFDYLGEPTPYNNDASNLLNFSDPAQRAAMAEELKRLGKLAVPSASSYFGIVDLCGFKKDRFYAYQARWRPEQPQAHILPHWNWPGREGQVTPVHVYTSGDEAELFLNGRSLGRRQLAAFAYRLRWDDVVYQPGTLKVVAYRKGRKWAEETVKTTGAPTQLLAAADRERLRADGEDLVFVTVTVADGEGLAVPRTHNLVKFAVEGPGEVVGVGNGDAASHEPNQALQRKAFNGLCLAVVRTRAGQPGQIRLRATAEGLQAADVTVRSE